MSTAVMPTYGRFDIAFEKGEGAYLFDTEGRKYLDFATGIAVNSLGHNHPHLVRVLTEQAGRVWHTSNLYRIPEQERLAQRLVDHSFADQVFFANSGAEAMECTIKIARKYHSHIGHPERFRVISFEGAFHGRTLATLAAGGQPKHLEGFGPVMDGFDQVPFGNMNAVRDAISGETAAILVEPIQGEGGIHPADPDFLRALRQACDEFGLLLLMDEVQTGMGRTGHLFAHELAGVAPDVMALAKGLGGGFPVGACLATDKAAAGMGPGSHGSTFGGNPLAAAVANGVLDVMLEPGFMDHVNTVAEELGDAVGQVVAKHPTRVKGLRGIGLMLGIACEVNNIELVNRLRENGLLAVGAGDNITRLLPPLTIESAHVNEAAAILDKTLADWGD